MRFTLKKKQVRLATLLPILGIVLAACSAAATPAPINTSAPSNTSAPTNTVVAPTETSAPENTSSNPLVGKWEGTDDDLGALTIEFKSDGTYEVTAAVGTFVLTYEMVDADTFTLTDPNGQVDTIDFELSGDKLEMTQQGSTLELHRVP